MSASVFAGKNNTIIVACDYDDRLEVKQIGGIYIPTLRMWELPFTMRNIERLRLVFPNIAISSDVLKKIGGQKTKEKRLLKLQELAKSDSPVRFKIPGIKLTLYNYQKLGVLFALANDDGVLLGDEMGLGKSCQAIATACALQQRKNIMNCLVIVPASLKYNWPIEIEKFSDEKYVVIDDRKPDGRIPQWLGHLHCRRNAKGKIEYYELSAGEFPFFYVVNYELVLEDLFGGRSYKKKDLEDYKEDIYKRLQKKGIVAESLTEEEITEQAEALHEKAKERARERQIRMEQLAPVRERSWHMLIADEAHSIKTHGSKRTRSVKKLDANFRMALTGTPLDGRLEELHSLMQFVRPGLFPSKTLFMQRHSDVDYWGKVIRYKNIGEVRELMAPFFVRRLKKDVLKELPDKVYENKWVSLSDEEMRVYKKLADRKHEITEDEEAMTAILRCKQFCNHPELAGVDDVKKTSKLDVFKEVLDELVIQNGHKVIVFSQYAEMNNLLIPIIEKMGIKLLYIWGKVPKADRAQMQETFEHDASIDIMLGTDAMSQGFNFTAADRVINYDDFWSPSVMSQRSDRCHRHGQKNSVTVISFICRDTIEERIRDILYTKAEVSSETLGDDADEMVLRRLNPKEILKLL